MARVIAYEVKVNGIRGVVTNQNDLTAAVKATTKAYKDADFGTDEYAEAQKELANLRNLQKKFRADVRQQAREQEIAADKGKESYRALNAELVNLRNSYKQLSRAERDAFGPQMLARINELDQELKAIDAEMGNYQRNVGNYANAFAELGGIDLAAFASVPGAIVAVGTAALQAGGYVLEMTANIRELRGEIQTLTDATGEELNQLTAQVAAIGETFDQVPSEVAQAANAVAEQFGIGFDDALNRIEEGFIAGSDITGEFLDSLREYPTFFAEAGLSADALFRVINQTVTEGIYSDKGADAIKEAAIRLRELPTATRDALDAISLDSQEIERQIAEEGIGAAIATVSTRLGELEADSPQVGEAIAGIFGGAGEDAGLSFLLSLENINEETGSLIDTTNEYAQEQARALEVNKEFAAVQVQVAESLGGAGATMENVGTVIQTRLLQVLVLLINNVKILWEALTPLREAFGRLGRSLGLVDENGKATERTMTLISTAMDIAAIPIRIVGQVLGFLVDQLASAIDAGARFLEWIGLVDPAADQASDAAQRMAGANGRLGGSIREVNDAERERQDETKKSADATDDLEGAINRMSAATSAAAVVTDAFAKDSVAALREEITRLRTELDQAGQADQAGILSRLVDAEAALEKVENFRAELRNKFSRQGDVIEPISLLPPPELQELETEEYAKRIVEARAIANREILDQQIDLADSVAEIQGTIFGGINSAIDNLAAASESRTQAEIAQLERRYEREIDLAEGNEARQEELAAELAEKRAQIERQEFEQQKRFRRAAVLSSFAEGVVNILSAPTTIPDPFGAVFKGLRLGILTATTATQLSVIDRQQAARGAKVRRPKGIKISNALAKGDLVQGFARGPGHHDNSEGIDIMLNGQPFLIEHGEFVDFTEDGSIAVVNKRSAAANRGALEAMHGRVFAGKGELLSSINAYRNYGIRYAQDGAIVRPASAAVAASMPAATQGPGRVRIAEESINQIAERTGQAVERGASRGVAEGMDGAARQNARRRRLLQRTRR